MSYQCLAVEMSGCKDDESIWHKRIVLPTSGEVVRCRYLNAADLTGNLLRHLLHFTSSQIPMHKFMPNDSNYNFLLDCYDLYLLFIEVDTLTEQNAFEIGIRNLRLFYECSPTGWQVAINETGDMVAVQLVNTLAPNLKYYYMGLVRKVTNKSILNKYTIQLIVHTHPLDIYWVERYCM